MWIEVGEEGSQNDPFVNYKLQIVIQFLVGVPRRWITDSRPNKKGTVWESKSYSDLEYSLKIHFQIFSYPVMSFLLLSSL